MEHSGARIKKTVGGGIEWPNKSSTFLQGGHAYLHYRGIYDDRQPAERKYIIKYRVQYAALMLASLAPSHMLHIYKLCL